MADYAKLAKEFKKGLPAGQMGVQDTGNPVLDSVVNLGRAHGLIDGGQLRSLHAAILELAKKEPGGLRARGPNGPEVVEWGSESDEDDEL